MLDKLYDFLINLIEYLSFRKFKKLDDIKPDINDDNAEILLKYDEIYNIENPFIM